MKQLFTILLLSSFLFNCSAEDSQQLDRTIFEKLEGQWQLVKKEVPSLDGSATVVEPDYIGRINIVITDTIIRTDLTSTQPNGYIEYFDADRYGNEPLDYYRSPIILREIREGDFESLDREQVFFRDFVLYTNHYYWPAHYIKEITENTLVFTIASFPIWPDMTYERLNK